MRRLSGPIVLSLSLLVLHGCGAEQKAPQFSTALSDSGCLPELEGPIPASANSSPYRRIQRTPEGYISEEYFIACSVGGTPYKTLVHVLRPEDASAASGIAIVEPWHRGNNWTVYSALEGYIVRKGHAALIVVGQAQVLDSFIKKANPERYASLTLPAAPLGESEVLAQAGAMVKLKGMPGLSARKLILAGRSSSAARVRAYIAEEHAKARIGGKSIYDGYFPAQGAVGATQTSLPETDAPIVEIQGERELLVHLLRDKTRIPYRRADGPFYRLYEIPGLSHIDTRKDTEANSASDISAAAYSDPRTWSCESKQLSPFPMYPIYNMTMDHLVRWVDEGVAPPRADRIEIGEGGAVLRDEYENAKGGVRTVYFDVPIASYRAVNGAVPENQDAQRCDWIGAVSPLPAERLEALYPTRAAYAAQFNARLDELVSQGWYLAEDAARLRGEPEKMPLP